MKKMICSDLDDTLLRSDGTIDASTKEAIKDYVNRGGIFCIVTGRMTPGALPICKELGLQDELATFQGAVITSLKSNEIIYSTTIDYSEAFKIGEFIEEKGFYYQTYIGDKFLTQKANEFTHIYGKLSNAKFEETEEKLSSYIMRNKINPPKILLMAEVNKISEMLQILRVKFGDKYLINTSKPFIIEIIPHGISKGLAVEKIANIHNVKREDIICIGDSENDITMLVYAGTGICVSNGSTIAKEFANVICPSNDAKGVEWVIRTYGQ